MHHISRQHKSLVHEGGFNEAKLVLRSREGPHFSVPSVCVFASEIHQDFVDNIDLSQDEDKPASASINHPYVFAIQQPWHGIANNHVPDTPPYGWPSAIAECHGKETACNNGCSSGSTKTICLKACGQYYKCNQAGSPSSGLRVDNENEAPSYSIAGIGSPLNSSSTAVQWHVRFSSFVQLSIALTTLIIIV
ncbi:hypothetical protein MAM1_0097d05099 [Mucor ambiguus]|uniref:Uncharacterized protein n=1 Tax=Mucor ambiguus TaxID=91626 RepID=A0A0C9MQQ3_9FUNG|nr:hypothetical protein MAM1_0097d05099 [Mucor ambiguus]